MIKVLIVTNKQDAHAQIVSDRLRTKGVLPIRWFPDEFLENQKIVQKITPAGEHFIKIVGEPTINLMDLDVVWHRRSQQARLPKKIPVADKKFVAIENRIHMKSLWLTLGESAKWINPFYSYDIANSKILQLRTAARLGLLIPETLITNDKNEIINFINENSLNSTGTVYKTFSPAIWEEQNKIFNCFTTEITSTMLLGEVDMSLTPGIFQNSIEKKHEVRITFFGDEYIAVNIHNSAKLDWRSIRSPSEFKLSHTFIPVDVERKCISLMQHLGIVFGCFDFIVTPSDEYIFLEVNEMGQFLWIEEILPELKLLDKFCDFLVAPPKKIKPSKTEINDMLLA